MNGRNWLNEQLPDETFAGNALRAEDLGDADTVILTVQDVRIMTLDDDEKASGVRDAFVFEFSEYPEKAFWANRTDLKIMADRFGKIPGKWIGQRVPLTVQTKMNPRTREEVSVLHIAPTKEWEDILAAAGERKGRTSAKKARRGR